MINNNLHISNKKRTKKKIVHIVVILLTAFILHHLLKFLITSNQKVSIGSVLGYLTAFIWIMFTEKNIEKIYFDDQEKKLTISRESIFGRKENLEIKYSELDYEVTNYGYFLSKLFGNKKLTILKSNTEQIILKSNQEFDEKEIIEIAKNLDSKRNASS